VIVRDSSFLLIRRAPTSVAFPDLWDIPGGHVEAGEGPIEALRRELWEETKYLVHKATPFYAFVFDYPKRDHVTPTLEIDYLCPLRDKRQPRLSPGEHTEFVWIRRYNARDYPGPPLLARILREARKHSMRLPRSLV
jgi:8-oxo-dGTP diphosphatase